MERSPKINARTGSKTESIAPPESDRLLELERRARELYKTETGGAKSDYPVQIDLPAIGLNAKIRPNRLKRGLPWIVAALGFFGITGSSVLGYWLALRAGVAELKATQAVQREQAEQIKALEAITRVHASRLTNLEGQAPLVVTGR